MLYCFLDTNILLHFQTFDEVKWHDILQRENVCLVITMQVIDDIDKFKNDASNAKRQKRAGIIDKKLDAFDTEVESIVREGVYLFIPKPISKSWLRENDFDVEDTDSIIIGEAKNFAELHPNLEVVCLSNDSGFRRRARLRGLNCIDPSDKIKRLPSEPDSKDKKLKELEKSVQELKNAQLLPDLIAGFRNSGSLADVLRFRVNFDYLTSKSIDIEKQVEQQRLNLRYTGQIGDEVSEDEDDEETIGEWEKRLASSPLKYPSPKQIAIYEQNVENYLHEYRNYLKELKEFYFTGSRTRPLYFQIENKGTTPAKDIDIKLHFPNGFSLSDNKLEFPYEPSPPKKPKAKTLLEIEQEKNSHYLRGVNYITPATPFPVFSQHSNTVIPTVRGPNIRKTNSYNVNFELKNLQHHFTYIWEPMYICFNEPVNSPTAFVVDCRILASNLPKPVEYQFRIHLD